MPYRATEPGIGSPNFRPSSPPRSKCAEVTNFSLKQRDRIGRRKLLLIGAAVFGTASVSQGIKEKTIN